MLGYLYQVRMALVLLLRRLKSDPGTSVTLENFDDIAFHSGGDPLEQLQTKLVTSKTLSDASTDLWKTLRVWSEQFRLGTLDPSSTSLTLLTTAEAPIGSAAEYLRPEERKHGDALQILEDVAANSLNASNQSAYQEFLRLSKKRRNLLIRSVYVLDRSPGMLEAQDLLRQELRIATTPARVDAFAKRIEGWWLSAVVEQLMGARPMINGADLESELADLREQFRLDNLPMDFADAALPTNENYVGANFVKQLQHIRIPSTRISLAMLDFYRASRQRGRWIDDLMIHEKELKSFERRLRETWLEIFEAEKQECDGTDMPKTGRHIYGRTTAQQIPLRPGISEPFIVRGSYHILSEALTIGWHPDYAALMGQGGTDEQ